MIDAFSNEERWEADAMNWLTSTAKTPFSYIWICAILHIDRVRLLEKILHAKASQTVRKGQFRRLVRC